MTSLARLLNIMVVFKTPHQTLERFRISKLIAEFAKYGLCKIEYQSDNLSTAMLSNACHVCGFVLIVVYQNKQSTI